MSAEPETNHHASTTEILTNLLSLLIYALTDVIVGVLITAVISGLIILILSIPATVLNYTLGLPFDTTMATTAGIFFGGLIFALAIANN